MSETWTRRKMGRWLSPDPYDGSYDIFNPQSLNRYAYVLNNPLTFVDPSGLECTTYQGGSWSVSAGGDTVAGSDPPVTVCTNPGGSGSNVPCPPILNAQGQYQGTGSCNSSSSSSQSSGATGTQSSAPNNGSFQLASYNPLNPCSNASPSGLDYSTANAQQHILQNHTPGGKGPSIYQGDWTAIQLLNGATLTQGTLAPTQFQRTGTFTLQWSAPPMIWPLSLIFTNNIGWGQTGQPTPTNRLVVKTNCSTVITSYPVTP